MSIEAGTLYIVATPLGNLGDITSRALEVLSGVDTIAAEDTRHSARLLQHYAISTPLIAVHEHNERQASGALIERLQAGESIALISDAGTPLISDPGYHLARAAHEAGVKLVPLPGPSALTTALSVSGLPTDHFCFEGFLPAKQGPRRKRLEALIAERRTLVFYEAPHRILDTLNDMRDTLGEARPIFLARELTKSFETLRLTTLAELCEWVAADPNQQRGECVLVLGGAEERPRDEAPPEEALRILSILREELPLKQAAALAAKISGEKKNALYKYALEMEKEER